MLYDVIIQNVDSFLPFFPASLASQSLNWLDQLTMGVRIEKRAEHNKLKVQVNCKPAIPREVIINNLFAPIQRNVFPLLANTDSCNTQNSAPFIHLQQLMKRLSREDG